jgi:hypothetical protein
MEYFNAFEFYLSRYLRLEVTGKPTFRVPAHGRNLVLDLKSRSDGWTAGQLLRRVLCYDLA